MYVFVECWLLSWPHNGRLSLSRLLQFEHAGKKKTKENALAIHIINNIFTSTTFFACQKENRKKWGEIKVFEKPAVL